MPRTNTEKRWPERLKAIQIDWAERHGLAPDHVEAQWPWVLRRSSSPANYYDQSWATFITGKEHRWSRALNSSQAFAVNLFGPLIRDERLARAVFPKLFPARAVAAGDIVRVLLEWTPEGGPDWLGERGQPTQVDAVFIVERATAIRGAVLVEVKLGETAFGSCRGTTADNPEPERCARVYEVAADVDERCWLTKVERRKYWPYIFDRMPKSAWQELSEDTRCPFSSGLYQLMRNRVLADAFRVQRGAAWSDVAVCIHPANASVRRLRVPFGPEMDIVASANALFRAGAVSELGPVQVVEAVRAAQADADIARWSAWMADRYQLDAPVVTS